MVSGIHKLLLAAAAALAMLLPAGGALAQRGGSEILFLDQQRVISESKAGQSIDQQLRTLTEQASAELEQIESQIEQEGQALKKSADEGLSNEELEKRYNTLLARAQRLEQLKQIRQAELNQARAKAISDLQAKWEPISDGIFKKRKGFVLLEKQAVLSADDRGDITDEVIKELDRSVQSIEVVKPDLQAQLAAAARAQQQQQAAP